MEVLLRTALDRNWSDTTSLAEALTCATRLDGPVEHAFLLGAPMTKIRKILSAELKPGRKLIQAVTFVDGTMEEETTTEVQAESKAGVTVAAPELGCSEPDLHAAELRAREVLFAFTTPEQQADFLRHNAFVSQGKGTEHRYMITSRHARDRLAHYRRQLFDLDENRAFCVHDYMVPAAEEMLTLHVLLQLPQWERYLRHLE